MKYLKIYLKKYLLGIGALLLVLSGVGIVYAATDLSSDAPGTATLGFEAYNCTSYEDLESCYADLQDEDVDMSTYRLADGDSIDAGGKFILISKIDNTGTGITSLNYRINYNNDVINVGEIAEAQEGEDVGAFYATEATDYPYYIVNMKVGKVTVPVPTNKFLPSATNSTNEVSTSPTAGKLQLRGFIEPQSSYSNEVLNAHQRLVYYGLEVSDSATGGTVLPFSYGAQATETDASTASASRVFLKGDTLTLKVSGGTTSGDNTLKTLETSYNGTTYSFDSSTPFVSGSKTTKTFLTYVPNSVDDIDINAVSNDASATISSALSDANVADNVFQSEDNSLNVGTNTFTFQVTAPNGDVEIYTINVYRLSNDATLSNLTASGISLTKNGDEYSAIVPYSNTGTTITATANHQNAKIASGTGAWTFTSSGSTINERDVVVQAENCDSKYITITDNSCTTKTYKVKITRNSASENGDLSDLKVGLNTQTPTTVGGFSKKGYTYTLEAVDYDINKITIQATPDDALSTIKSGTTGTFNVNVGDNEYKVIVVSQDGNETPYTIKLHRKSNDTLLHSITITSSPTGNLAPAFTQGYTGKYTYTYDPNVTSVTITSRVNDLGKAKIAIVDATGGFPSGYASSNQDNQATQTFTTPDTTVAVIIVTSETGTIQTYYIDLTRQQSINNSLSNLKVEYNDGTGDKTAVLDPTFSSSKKMYSVTVPANITSVVVTPTKAISYSKVTEIGDVTGEDLTSATISGLNFGSKQIIIKVLSEAGVDNEYYLTINRSKYNIATLDALAFGDGSLTPVFASDKTSYTYSDTLDFATTTLPISGTITNSYATVKVEVQNEKGVKTNQTITSNASARTFSGTLNIPTGTNKVLVTVTAHDGTTNKVYETTVKRDKNSDSSVTQIVVDGQTGPATFDSDTNTYTVEIINTKTSLQPSEVGISVSPDATVNKGSAITGIKTTEPSTFTFTVTAENGTSTNYELKVQRKKNTAAQLTRETITVGTKTYYCDITTGSKGCTISVPTSTTNFTTTSTISAGATVDPVDGTEFTMASTESTKEISVIVTSEDESSSTEYTITVERAKSSDNSLSDLQVDGVTVSGFNPTGNLFSNIQGGLTNKVTITATVNDTGKAYVASATVNGTVVIPTGSIEDGIYSFDANLNYGANNVVITVKAENEQPQNYNLTITRQQNTTATIEEILIGVGDQTPALIDGYSPGTANYTITAQVPYDTSTIKLVALPSDETYGSAIVSSVKNEKNSVTATNIANEYSGADSNRYEATITLATGVNTIEVTGTAHNGTTKKYTIKITRVKNDDSTIADVKVKGFDVVDLGSNIFTVELPNSETTINTATDITYTAPVGSKVTFSPVNMSLVTISTNDITMIVTAEDGTATTYTIKVVRQKSSNVKIQRVSLTVTSTDADYNGKSYFCVFDNTDSTTCTLDVPASTTAYKVYTTGGDVSTGTASVSPINGTEFTMDATESTKPLKVTVTAEDGITTQDYDITVRRMKSTNADLSSLKVDGTSVVNFQRGTQIYYYSVDGDTDEVNISATVYDSRSTIETDLSEPFELSFGLNNISVKVVAEDGSATKTYTILLTRNNRKDATLSDIKIDGVSINDLDITPTPYDKDNVFEYTINDEYSYTKTSVEIEGIVNDKPVENPSGSTQYGAHVTSGNGTNSLKTGTTDITIHVVAHDTTITKDYILHIKRKLNDDTSLATVVLAGQSATYNETEGVWEVTVPNSVTDATQSNLIITPSPGATINDALASVSFTDTALSSQTPTDITVAITAEDGTTGTQVIRVVREKSGVATLHSLSVSALSPNDGSFNPSFVPDSATDLAYTVTVPAEATSLRIAATTTEANAKILTNLSNSFAITESQTQYQIRVESEDGKTHLTYELNIKRTSSNDNTLRKVTVTSGEGESLVTYKIFDGDASVETEVLDGNYAATPHYKVTVPGNIDKVNIEAITTDSRATIENANTLLGERTLEPNKTLIINIKVKSEGGTSQTYTLNITRLPKTNNRLSDLRVDNVTVPDFDPDVLEYTLEDVPNETASIIIGAIKEDQDANITKGIGTANLKTGDNTIEIVVEAQDKSERTYKIKVKRKQSDDNRLSSLSVNGYSLTPNYVYTTGEEVKDYYVTLRYTKDKFSKSDVYALAHNNTATITYDEEITLATGETKSFNVYVTSESGLLNTYTINVTRSKSDNAFLSSVAITTPTSVGSITPKFSKNTVTYNVSIPYGESTFTITGTPEVETTSVQGNNQTYNVADVTEVFLTTYAEMYDPAGTPAEQNATMTYKFIISQALSNNAYLSNLSVDGYPFVGLHPSFSQAFTTYDIGDIDYSVSGLVIHATPENGNSKVTYSVNGGPQSNDNTVELPNAVGSGSITITVTAPDGLSKIPYTITYNKVYSSVAYLAALTSEVGTWDKSFMKTTTDYLLTVDNTITSVDLTLYTESVLANVSINGGLAVSATNIKPLVYKVENLPEGDTALAILVTAQDNSNTKTYNVVIRRAKSAANSDATLQDLEVVDYPFVSSGSYTHTTFEKTVSDYSIGEIPYSLEKLKVNYHTTQGESSTSILVGGSTVIADSDGYIRIPKENTNNGIITVLVVAPDGKSTKTYSIHYTKKASENAFLSSLVVSNGTLTPAFNKNLTDYNVTLDEGVTVETITATLEDSNATLTVAGQVRTSPYAYTLSGLGSGTTQATFVVTAEDGHTLTYYVNVTTQLTNETITSVTYGHVIGDGMIKDIKNDTTGLDLKNQLDNDNSKLVIYDKDDLNIVPDSDPLGTAMIVKLIKNSHEEDRKLIVVLGDTNGDAVVDVFDVLGAANHIMGSVLTGPYFTAGDVDQNLDIDVFDVLGIATIVMNS